MKNLLLITRYFPPVQNGLSDHSELISQLMLNKYSFIYVISEQYEDRCINKTDIETKILIQQYKGNGGLIKSISQICKNGNIEVVLFQYVPHMWGKAGFSPIAAILPLWIHIRFGLPVVSYLHELYYDLSKNPKKLLLSIIHRIQLMFIASASKALIITNYRREKLLKRYWPSKVYRIPAGNVSGRKDDNLRIKIYNFPYITWFGTISEDQRLQCLIEAFCMIAKENRELRLVLVGGFDVDSEQISRIKKMGIDSSIANRIIIRGFVSDEELSDILHGSIANIFIAASGPSGRRGVVGAYLRSGKAIVSINGHESDPEFISGENIIFVPDNDTNAMTKAIEHIINDNSLRDKLEQGARDLYLNHYSDEIIMNKLHHVFLLNS